MTERWGARADRGRYLPDRTLLQERSGIAAGYLIAALASIGVVVTIVFSQLGSGARLSAEITQVIQTRNMMAMAARYAAVDARDVDGDGILEPPAMNMTGDVGSDRPDGGGAGGAAGRVSSVIDRWNRRLGYCAWDHAGASGNAGLIAGSPGDFDSLSGVVAALFISAGPDGVFSTSCADGAAGDISGDDIAYRSSLGELTEMSAQWVPLDDGTGAIAYLGTGGVGVGDQITDVDRAADVRLAVSGNIRSSNDLRVSRLVSGGNIESPSGKVRILEEGQTSSVVISADASLFEIGGRIVDIQEDSIPCAPATYGMVRLYERRFEVCNGSEWKTDGGAAAPPPPPQDDTPDPFYFTNVTDAVLALYTYSNTVSLTGFTGSLEFSISGSGSPQVSINGGPWSTSATAVPGDTAQIRLMGTNFYTTYGVNITFGAYSPNWAVTTGNQITADRSPDSFSVASHIVGASDFGEFFQSNSITITGISGPVLARSWGTTGGGQVLSVNGSSWVNESIVYPGDTIVFGGRAATEYGVTYNNYATIGNSTMGWSISTNM